MRHIACHNVDCDNSYAPYFDFEPAETIVLCPVCKKAMTVATLDELEPLRAAKTAAASELLATLPPEEPDA